MTPEPKERKDAGGQGAVTERGMRADEMGERTSTGLGDTRSGTPIRHEAADPAATGLASDAPGAPGDSYPLSGSEGSSVGRRGQDAHHREGGPADAVDRDNADATRRSRRGPYS